MSVIQFTSAEEYLGAEWATAIYLPHKSTDCWIFPQLEVSTLGDIRWTYDLKNGTRAGKAPRVRTRREQSGYNKDYLLISGLADSNGTVRQNLSIHRFVLSTFDPDGYKAGLEVHHINEIQDDNRLGNLQWLSGKQNLAIRDSKH